MTDLCSPAHQAGGFIGSVTGYLDCQAQTLGTGAWAALATPSSTLMVVLTAFLTIFIALIGYNLLLGASFTVRGVTLAFVKIGAVFALATSWPAYRTVVYDLVTDGPGQIVSEIGPRAGVTGSDGTLLQRLDATDQLLVRVAILGGGQAPAYAYNEVQPPPFIGFDSFALGGSRILFLISAIAGLSIVRVIAGLLLALGPFFIALLMFDHTRSLFEGWVRVLAGVGLAAIAVSIVLGIELGLLEPWASNVLARRMAGEPLPSMPTELFVIACLFTLILLVTLYACFRVTSAFRLAPLLKLELPHSASSQASVSNVGERARGDRGVAVDRSRAAAIANTFTSVSRREAGHAPSFASIASLNGSVSQPRTENLDGSRPAVPLGRSFNRKPGARVSALASRRDGTA